MARLSSKQPLGLGSWVQAGLRTSSVTELAFVGAIMSIGTIPEPIMLESAGRNRSPLAPVGSRLRNTMRTGLSLVAPMNGPRYWGAVTPRYPPATGTLVPSSNSLVRATCWLMPALAAVSSCT